MAVDAVTRRRFIDELRALDRMSGAPDLDRVLAAFAAVPRERFAGPGPWTLFSVGKGGLRADRTPDADPRHLYRPVLVALDEERGINIGDPTLWAPLLARVGVPEGGRVLQAGAGSGYYTAILAELVGPDGHVDAYETEARLIGMADAALADRSNVALHHDNAVGAAPARSVDLVIAFAGVTRPPRPWCDALAPRGRMLLPVTGSGGWGAMALFERDGEDAVTFAVTTLGPCGFYPCHGARDPIGEHEVDRLFADRSRLDGATLRGRWRGDRFVYE